MISAVITNLNEEKKMERCLTSLSGFADEIVVLDLGSTDKSLEICNKHKVKVFKHDFVPYVEKVRNYAVLKAEGDWILVLDPDEMISETLKVKLKQIVTEDKQSLRDESLKYQAVSIPRKNIFFGKWIAHTNWWPDKHVRFFKKGHVKWGTKIHQYPEVSGKILDLENREELAIIHFGYESVAEFLDRQNRYSSIEALNLYGEGMRFSWKSFFWQPFREFLVRFIKYAGFLDGFFGLALTVLMMIYRLQVMIKLWELERR